MYLNDYFIRLKELTEQTLLKCSITKSIIINNKERDLKLHVPSGDMKYKSFWIRDAAMMAESMLISSDELKGWIDLILDKGINTKETLVLENELTVPKWAVCDHIDFTGGPVYYPGPYEAGRNQGDGTYGKYPPHDNNYYFIEMAYIYFKMDNDVGFLKGYLENIFKSYNIDQETELCESKFPGHTVDWGFCDTVIKSGLLLFPSLLRYRAALRLKEMYNSLIYELKAQTIRRNIINTFYESSGWLLSATELCRQEDVFGTAFALWLDILPETLCLKTANTLLKAYKSGISGKDGYLKHIPGKDSSWEKATSEYMKYQNGGYWSVALGWYAYGLSLINSDMGFRILNEFIDHTAAYKKEGAPYEWKSWDNSEYSGLYYGPSIALPYTAMLRLKDCYNITA